MKWIIAQGSDWEGIFVDGELIMQGHSFSTGQVANIARQYPPSNVETKMVDIAWLEDRGWLPEKLGKVKWGCTI